MTDDAYWVLEGDSNRIRAYAANELESSDAHLFQSVGTWTLEAGGGSPSFALVSDPASFAGKAGRITSDAGGPIGIQTQRYVYPLPSPGPVTFLARVHGDGTPGRRARIIVNYEDGGGTLAQAASSWVDIPSDESMIELDFRGTTHASTVYVRPRIQYDTTGGSAITAGEFFYLSDCTLSAVDAAARVFRSWAITGPELYLEVDWEPDIATPPATEYWAEWAYLDLSRLTSGKLASSVVTVPGPVSVTFDFTPDTNRHVYGVHWYADGSDNSADLYVDGELEETQTDTGGTGADISGYRSPLDVGRASDALIRRVRLWDGPPPAGSSVPSPAVSPLCADVWAMDHARRLAA